MRISARVYTCEPTYAHCSITRANADVGRVHEKVWQDIPGRWGVLGLWRVKMGKMLGYWDERREFERGGTESAGLMSA